MYLQAEYKNFVELKEPIIREAEEAIARGTLVQSARRFLEGLEQSRAPYSRKLELLEEQVRLAQEKRNQQWLKQAAIGADRAGFRSREWICRNIYDIGPRRQRPQTVRERKSEIINELYTTGGTQKDWREVDPQVSDAQDPTLKEKSPSITLEEEERLLASSPDVSIHAGEGFESDSNPVSQVIDQPSQPSESMDQSAQPQRDLGARPKEYKSASRQRNRSDRRAGHHSDVTGRSRSDRHASSAKQKRGRSSPSRHSTRQASHSSKRGRHSPSRSTSRHQPSRSKRGNSPCAVVVSRSDRRTVTSNQARGVSPVRSTPSGYPVFLAPRHEEHRSFRRSTTSTRPVPTATVSRLQDSRHVGYSSSGDLQVQVGAMGDVDVRRRSASGVPDAFDASCHYFQMLTELTLHRTVNPFQAFSGALTEPGREVNVRSAVLVFSDPLLFPTPEEIHSFRSSGMSIVLGVKPKMRITQGQLDELANLRLMPEVAALGELGVDHTAPIEEWIRQTDDIVKQLDCLPRGQRVPKILVVKCRGMKDADPSEAFDVLLKTLHIYVPGTQLIHFTCFTGDHQIVEKWLKSFPQTYFGFSKRVDSFTEAQKEALRKLDDCRILLETYSPYIKFGAAYKKFPGSRGSTPAQLGMTAEAVAKVRGGSWRDVLASATRNAARLYQERKEPNCDWSSSHREPFR